jgi:hypothetical protein
MATQTTAENVVRTSSGRGLVLLGIAICLLALAAYVVQVWQASFITPWYWPIAGTIGVLLILAGTWQAWSVLRIVALLFFGLLAAGEWFYVAKLSLLPPYSGPLAVGELFPAFATLRADGSSFTQQDLAGDRDTVLVFFRGRW